jgi:flagellar M-ring protein FliF
MDLFNKAFSQLSDLLRSMTPGGRLTAGLLLVVVVVSLGYLFQHQMSGPDGYLMNDEPIPASYLPAMEAALGKANLTYTAEGGRIRIPRGQQAAYMAALADAKALPPNFGSALRGALDAGSPFESPKQRELRFKIALQEELSRIIRQMTGIEEASVLIDSQQQAGLSQEKLATASISVKPQGSEPLDPSRVSAIRGLVAGAIAGLKPDNVIVADLNTGRVFHGDPQQGGEGSDNLYLAIKEAYERALKGKLLNALSYILGLTVEATVELDHERSSRSQSLKVDPKTVPLRITEKTKTRTRDGTSGGGGRPGFQAANTPATLASSPAAKGSREEEEDSGSSQESEPILREHIEKETVGLTPKRATVAVGIPSSYFEKVWHERNPVKEGEEPKAPDAAALDAVREEVLGQVRKQVTALLPPLPAEATQNTADPVTITAFQDIKPGALPGPSTVQKVLAWLSQHWSTLGLIGLVGAGLLMLRSMVRGVPAPEPSTVSLRVAATPEVPSEPGEAPETVAAKRLRRLVAGGPNLRDELSELVKEDPDAAANILRTWIGQAG